MENGPYTWSIVEGDTWSLEHESESMIGENWRLVTDEPVEFEK